MSKTVADTRAKLEKETLKLAKKTAAVKGHPVHSRKRHYAKLQAQKIRGRLAQLQNLLEKLIRRQQKEGPRAAVRWALAQVGTTESPPYSNLGPTITQWQRNTGYRPPPGVFWCGCFASEAVVGHGKAKIDVRSRCGYGPYVMADAEHNANGFREVPFNAVRPGDYLIFFNGEHQGMARSHAKGDTVDTIEGNTSPSSSGSQFNGGCVAAKTRNRGDVTVVARPAYP